MVWQEARDPRALCNDYSRAGFFLRRNSSSERWIIFLESGSLCFSSSTCNRRFFRSEVANIIDIYKLIQWCNYRRYKASCLKTDYVLITKVQMVIY